MGKFFVFLFGIFVTISSFASPPWTGVEGPDGNVGKIPFFAKPSTAVVSLGEWDCVLRRDGEGKIRMFCVHATEGTKEFVGREYLINRCPDSPAYIKWKNGNTIDPEYFLYLYKENCR